MGEESPFQNDFGRQGSMATRPQTTFELLQQPLVPGAQETRFGGREAVNVEQAQHAFGHSAEAGLMFGGPQGATRARRKPGHMPWRTFLYATATLIALWVLGTLFIITEVWELVEIHWETEDADNPHGKTRSSEMTISRNWKTVKLDALQPEIVVQGGARHDPTVLYDGKWPHFFFTPRDIGCHEVLGQSIFIIEKYAVHQLIFNESGSIIRPALEDCLMEHPEFLSQGLASISIECETTGACHAAIFSAAGLGGLRCPLSEDPLYQRGKRFHIYGGNWRSVTSSNDGGAWALFGNVIVKLAGHPSLHGELVPHYEAFQSKHVAAIERLHVLRNKKLLGLDPSGWLRSWPLSGNEGPHALRLSPKFKMEWIGLCSIGSTLYFGGVNKDRQGATVWQMRPRDFARTSVMV